MPDSEPTIGDLRLAERVHERLNEFEPIESVGGRIRVTSNGGNVELCGHVRSDVHSALAAQIARETSGVQSVRNQLVSDSRLRSRVGTALARNPEFSKLSFAIESNLGEIRMGGNVTDLDLLDRARALALRVDGVLGVITAATAE